MAVESLASLAKGGNTLGPVFLIGLVLTMLGLLVLGVAGLARSRVRWAAPLTFAGFLISIALGDRGGSIGWGVILWGLALVLSRGAAPEAARTPTPALLQPETW